MYPRLRLLALAALLAGIGLTAAAATETYTIDATHSSVGFSVRNFFSKVPGSFTKAAGTITVDRDNLERSSVTATIDVASIDTGDPKRDKHLRSDDFFDAAKFPAMIFKSRSWQKTGASTFDVAGDLTIKDVTKAVVLKVKSLGFEPGASRWEATTTLNRRDFGISYGPGVVGNDVEVSIKIEASRQK